MDDVNIAVVGAGYWGSNHVRNFATLESLHTVCDKNESRLQKFKKKYPFANFETEFNEVLTDSEVDGVVITTPSKTHYELGKRALKSGKDLFIEKPLTFSKKKAHELKDLADSNDAILMVGHILLYHPVVQRLQELINAGELGDLNYAYARRVNLGKVRTEANVIWNLVVHDLAVILEIFDGKPIKISAKGQDFLQDDVEDVAFVTVYFDSGQLAHFHASWLDPHKVRRLTFVGEEKMAVIDDVDRKDQLAIHDKTVDTEGPPPQGGDFTDYLATHKGDTVLNSVNMEEPLKKECEEFIRSIAEGTTPITGGEHAIRVTDLLHAANKSLKNEGVQIEL